MKELQKNEMVGFGAWFECIYGVSIMDIGPHVTGVM